MSKLFRLFPCLLLISGICFFPLSSVSADGENGTDNNNIGFSISPKDTFFDISNMKPGDWAHRTITVENTGSEDFVYHMKLQNSGEKKLFNELLLEMKVGEQELYRGKLAAFKSLPARKMSSDIEENLDITIRFPEQLGNDFQGLKSVFAFSFTAQGKNSTAVQVVTLGQIDSGGPTTAGFSLPTTSTNLFNFMLLGTALAASGIVLMIIRYYRRMKLAR